MDFKIKNKIIGIPVRQNQQEFVLGVFTIDQVLKFTKFTERLIVGYNDENIPEYNPQIQRKVEPSRVEKIADFLINDRDATFPTNVVLHIPIQVIEKQEKLAQGFVGICLDERVFKEVEIEQNNPSKGDIYITIIDGQHRIRGIEVAIERLRKDIELVHKVLISNPENQELQSKYEYFNDRLRDLLNIQLVVTFFIDKTLEYQAMIFSTINRTQKRVSESLVYSLFGLTTDDSPQKSALQITLALNAHPKSPFHNRVKLYGGSYDRGQSPPLSQATMVKSIVQLICENWREAENDRYRPRKDLLKRQTASQKYLPFRNYYALDEDTKISDIFYYYFSAVKEVFAEGETFNWDFDPQTMNPTNVLQTTVGYQALLQLLNDILEFLDKEKQEDKKFNKLTYVDLLLNTKGIINVQDTHRYPFTSKTKNIFYLDLSLSLWPETSPDDPRRKKLTELLK